MPTKHIYGDRLDPGSVGPRQTVANPTSKAASPPIQGGYWCRNGKHPSPSFISALNEAVNQAALYRSKCVYSNVGRLFNSLGAASTSDIARWRFAFHTGPYAHAVYAVVAMLPTDLDIAPYEDYNTQGRLDIFSDTQEAVNAGSYTFTYGAHPTGVNSTVSFQHIKVLTGYIEVSPDTDYTGLFSDVNVGRIQSACVFELASLTENNSGYLSQNITSHSSILDVYREKQATMIRSLWRRGGATVFNWSVDDPTGSGPVTATVSGVTSRNVIDTTITTVSASSPGWTLDMRNRARLSQTSGVPCRMVAYGKMSAGTDGDVYLKNSAGTNIATITNGFTTTPKWVTTTFNMPATLDKYDLHIGEPAAGTFSLYAVSIYHYET